MNLIKKIIATIITIITALSLTSCAIANTAPAEMTNSEMESKINELESKVAELEEQIGVPDGTVKTSYEELIAVCKDIFSQTVTTDLECVEDPDFGVPEGIDKTGFISATYRTNDSATEPSYFVTVWYDSENVLEIEQQSFLYNMGVPCVGITSNTTVYYRTSNPELTQQLILQTSLS